MTTTPWHDPRTKDLYVQVDEVWIMFTRDGYQAVVDETVVPDHLEAMVPLMPVRRNRHGLPPCLTVHGCPGEEPGQPCGTCPVTAAHVAEAVSIDA